MTATWKRVHPGIIKVRSMRLERTLPRTVASKVNKALRQRELGDFEQPVRFRQWE